jgi:serine/threonine protein phosphatase PrpC
MVAEPEILEVPLNENDKIIILASDGIWDYLTNNDVMRIVTPFYETRDSKKAAQSLLKQAVL